MPPLSRLRIGFLAAALAGIGLASACSNAEPIIPTINTPPVAQAGGPYTGVVGEPMALDGRSSTDQEGEIASYAWTVEDGGPTELAGASPLYRCPAAGTFPLTLTVRDSNGAGDSDTGSIACVIVNTRPNADTGGPYVSRLGEVATLDGSGSSDADGTIVSWQWTVDDGVPTALDGETASYSCSTQGEFTVTLTVADDGGETGTSTTTLQCVQNVPPTASTGGPFSVRIGDQAFLDGRGSIDPDGSIVSYRWEVEDGGPTVFNSATAFFRCTSAETLDVTLTVTDNEGASDSEATTLGCVANVPPVADPGGPYSVDQGVEVSLDGTGSDDPDGNIVSWVWSIADPGSPTVLNGETQSYICSAAGTWSVTLTVADNEGGTSTGTTSVTCVPNQPPTAATGGPYTIREGRSETLDGRGSTDLDGSIVSYAWSLDGAAPFSNSDVTNYTCTAAGEFDLTLTVTDDDGDSGSATTSLDCVANVGPTADPGGPYGAGLGESVTLDGSASDDPDGSVTSWSWSIADGGEPTLLMGSSASYTCTVAGTHDVILTVSDNDGATDSDATAVACNALPTAEANGPYSAAAGATVTLSSSGSNDPDGSIETFQWSIDDGDATGFDVEDPVYTCPAVLVQTDFTATLTVTDDLGATASDDATITCTPPPTPVGGNSPSGAGAWPR